MTSAQYVPDPTADHRVLFFGDSLTAGAADPEGLGWIGRLSNRSRAVGFDLTAYNLGVRGDTTADIERRWRIEAEARLGRGDAHYFVVSSGVNDSFDAPQDYSESTAAFRSLITGMSARAPTLVIGPQPIADHKRNGWLQGLESRFSQLAAELDVPYVPVLETLQTAPGYLQEVAAVDGAHPVAAGYDAVAKLVAESGAWWFPTSPSV